VSSTGIRLSGLLVQSLDEAHFFDLLPSKIDQGRLWRVFRALPTCPPLQPQ
jgi:hypothetical protein